MAAAFRCRLGDYKTFSNTAKLGALISAGAASGFASHLHSQTDAWLTELNVIGSTVDELLATIPISRDWWILLEYEIPRRANRPDAVVLADDVIFVIEFKIGATSYSAVDEWQVQSYALDLRDFHHGSLGRRLIPVLVVSEAPDAVKDERVAATGSGQLVWPVQRANKFELSRALCCAFNSVAHDASRRLDPDEWEHSTYRPTPTIIEAAEQLFAGHGVANISHAFATNLDKTTAEIVRAIASAQAASTRTICFVTGSPGAGKTLAGLNAAHDPQLRTNDRPPAIFLSGNGPLVKIVREALVRDKQRDGLSKKEAARVVSTFIANIHSFLSHYGIRERNQVPPEHAIIFDEAQRAWTAEAVTKKHRSVDQSEPTMILEIMERLPDWCTVVALVGNGQEIHQGEAGIEEWGRALNARYSKLACHGVTRAY